MDEFHFVGSLKGREIRVLRVEEAKTWCLAFGVLMQTPRSVLLANTPILLLLKAYVRHAAGATNKYRVHLDFALQASLLLAEADGPKLM
jgi:hypothetical protein